MKKKLNFQRNYETRMENLLAKSKKDWAEYLSNINTGHALTLNKQM